MPPAQLAAVHHALREFDRFLDHHPLLEYELRQDPALVRDEEYLHKNTDLGEFFAENPQVVPGLQYYPRYFLYHALLQQARAPLRYAEVAQLKDVLDQHPGVEQALRENPELIRDETFVHGHGPLADFLLHHPQLSDVFLPPHPSPQKRS